LKAEQVAPLKNILNGQHCLVVLPTGFGKTDIFILPPLMMDILEDEKQHFAIVIVPLLSLMFDMVVKYRVRGVEIVAITQASKMTPDDLDGIKNGRYSIILISPELLLANRMWIDTFATSDVYRRNVILVAIDEAHLLIEW